MGSILHWHDESHDGELEYSSLRVTAGSLNLFVNIGIELDGMWSARIEVLNDCEEITGFRDERAAKRAAVAKARELVAQLKEQLDRIEESE